MLHTKRPWLSQRLRPEFRKSRRIMIIFLVGLIVVIMAILSFLGLR
jgi:hypothetical protein